jgi:hypothetical protein
MLAAKRVVAGECGRTRACTPPLNLHLRENWTRPPSMRERLNLDARRSFRPSASLFSARSAASKAHSTNPVVTKHDTGLTTSRPSAPGGGGVTCRPYRTHDHTAAWSPRGVQAVRAVDDLVDLLQNLLQNRGQAWNSRGYPVSGSAANSISAGLFGKRRITVGHTLSRFQNGCSGTRSSVLRSHCLAAWSSCQGARPRERERLTRERANSGDGSRSSS